jgi:hypothetical protein
VKQLVLLAIPLLSVWACAPPAPTTQPIAQMQVAPTTSRVFDGVYANPVVTAKTATCPNVNPPALTITNGLAQGPNFLLQGYVSPQGALAMHSDSGQTFQGQIDQQFVLRGHVAGPNCAYDVAWTRV